MPTKVLKKIFPGVSWRNPLLNFVFHILNPIDFLVRSAHGLTELPPYSIRVRSNGVTKQFGGQNFFNFGKLLAELLKKYASLNNSAKVLEIGCGCGRTAYALTKSLDDGNYVGVDIDKTSLRWCQEQRLFASKRFTFNHLDVQNNEYNPEGQLRADKYRFPYGDNEFDVIFLVSVFTHMPTDDVKNYIREISRMLKPEGTCMVTTFLMDKGRETGRLSFPYKAQDHYYYNPSLPEIAVGYYLDFYLQQFASSNMQLVGEPLWGGWRTSSDTASASGFSQDIVFFSKNRPKALES